MQKSFQNSQYVNKETTLYCGIIGYDTVLPCRWDYGTHVKATPEMDTTCSFELWYPLSKQICTTTNETTISIQISLIILQSQPHMVWRLRYGIGWLKNRGSIIDKGSRFFSFPQCSDRLCVPPTLSDEHKGALSRAVKRSGRETVQLSRYSAYIKNIWSYTATPLYILKARCIFKHRNKFTLALPPVC